MQRRGASDQGRVAGFLTITRFRDGKRLGEVGRYPNKVVSSSGYGRNLIARRLVGDSTYGIEIDSASLGDDSTAATDAQTDLLNPLVEDIPITNASASGGLVTIDVFVADANLPDDSYREFGLYCNGRLFARVVLGTAYTKVSGEDTLFTYELNLT